MREAPDRGGGVYRGLISRVLGERGLTLDPALIECLMRLDPVDEGSVRTLDGLSREDFEESVVECAAMVAADPAGAYELAVTVGYRGPRP